MRAKILWVLICWVGSIAGLESQASINLIPVEIQSFPVEADVFVQGEFQVPWRVLAESRIYRLPPGKQRLTLACSGYEPRSFTIDVRPGLPALRERLLRLGIPLHFLGEISTGSRPKSVRFTPDGRYMAVALLNGPGVEIYRVRPLIRLALLLAPGFSSRTGFVETWMLPQRGELWVSQMTTGHVHCFRLKDFSYIDSFSTMGTWSKFILVDKGERFAYISNWTSQDVSIIDVDSRQVISRIPTPGTPRGLALSPNEEVLYVSIFDGAVIFRYSLSTRQILEPLRLGSWGAMRHLVTLKGKLYASDMGSGYVYRFDALTGRLESQLFLGWNINTIAVDGEATYLFASSRGRNNPDSYLLPGPDYGKVYLVSLGEFTPSTWIWGRDQPTGLDVSPDGRYLAFTDFLSDRLELYAIRRPGP